MDLSKKNITKNLKNFNKEVKQHVISDLQFY